MHQTETGLRLELGLVVIENQTTDLFILPPFLQPYQNGEKTRGLDICSNEAIREGQPISHSIFAFLSFSVTGTRFYSQKVVDSIRNKPVWLGDISTYPTIAVCGAGCVGALGYSKYDNESWQTNFFLQFTLPWCSFLNKVCASWTNLSIFPSSPFLVALFSQ